MMWTPTSSACRMLSTSRGLAHSSSSFGSWASAASASVISGIGSRPVSAIRPAKTETTWPGPPSDAAATASTWAVVISAVTLRCTPSADSSRITLVAGHALRCW